MVSLAGIRKRFGTVRALDGVSLDLRPGEIHALLGENGAGKTTLMKILYGLLRPDAGQIRIDGRPVDLRRPEDARRLGTGMVHQHFMLVERMTVAENVLLGDRTVGFWQSPASMCTVVSVAARRLGFDIDATARIESLSLGQRQRVELLKVLRHPVRTLILDEPTAVLTPGEVEPLFATLRQLRDGGCAIVFISHKLDEVLRLCDRVTVLRHGRTSATAAVSETNAAQLAAQMVGRRPEPLVPESRPTHITPPLLRSEPHGASLRLGRAQRFDVGLAPPRSEPVLDLRGVTGDPHDAPPGLIDASLQIRAGEIVGVAGVDGNGQDALVGTILGLRQPKFGDVRIRADRIGHIAADRQREALVLPLSVAENVVLKSHTQPQFSCRGVLRWRSIRDFAHGLIREFAIRTPSERAAAADLSGGNQQKLVVGRELSDNPPLVIAVNPTRGLDIAATEFVRRRLLDQRERGAALLLVSSDLDEILALSDRIVVLYGGRLYPTNWPRVGVNEIGALMAGVPA